MKKFFLIFTFLFSFSGWAICDGHVESITTTDPTVNEPWKISTQVFRPLVDSGEIIPVVFILPPIIGSNTLDRSLALRLCLNGIGSYILNASKDISSKEEVSNFFVHNDAVLRAQAGVSAAIDQLASDPEVSGKFGILGASLGGILSSYIAGVVPEIEASVILAGAGNLPGVLAYSEQEAVARTRNERMQRYSIPNQDVYFDVLRPFIHYDPLMVAENIAPDSMFMFIVTRDEDVPTRYQEELRAAVPAPQVREINNTHAAGIVQAGTLYGDEIVQFFQEKLSE